MLKTKTATLYRCPVSASSSSIPWILALPMLLRSTKETRYSSHRIGRTRRSSLRSSRASAVFSEGDWAAGVLAAVAMVLGLANARVR